MFITSAFFVVPTRKDPETTILSSLAIFACRTVNFFLSDQNIKFWPNQINKDEKYTIMQNTVGGGDDKGDGGSLGRGDGGAAELIHLAFRFPFKPMSFNLECPGVGATRIRTIFLNPFLSRVKEVWAHSAEFFFHNIIAAEAKGSFPPRPGSPAENPNVRRWESSCKV